MIPKSIRVAIKVKHFVNTDFTRNFDCSLTKAVKDWLKNSNLEDNIKFSKVITTVLTVDISKYIYEIEGKYTYKMYKEDLQKCKNLSSTETIREVFIIKTDKYDL